MLSGIIKNIKVNIEAENCTKKNRLTEILSTEYDSKEEFYEDYFQNFLIGIWPSFAERIDNNTPFSSEEYLDYVCNLIIIEARKVSGEMSTTAFALPNQIKQGLDESASNEQVHYGSFVGQVSVNPKVTRESGEKMTEVTTQEGTIQTYTPTEVEALIKCSTDYQQKVVVQMQKLTETFMKTQEQINQFQSQMREGLGETRNSIMDFRNAVNDAYYGGATKELTMLHRTMLQAGIPETEGFVAWLKNIIGIIGLEEISPEKGEIYNPLLHEKQYNSQFGSMVKECLNPGWKRSEEVILKAVVTIAESCEG